MATLGGRRTEQLSGYSYDDVWDHLYFGELASILSDHWSAFQNYFSVDKSDVEQWLDHVNRCRVDAHAKSISDEDFMYLRVCFERLEEKLGIVY